MERLNEPSKMAAECSPERKPGDQSANLPEPATAGDRGLPKSTQAPISVAPPGLRIILRLDPRAHARGYVLPPALAGSVNASRLKSVGEKWSPREWATEA